MDKNTVIDRVENALAWVDDIDLRGRHKGSPIHDSVTKARIALVEARDVLSKDESE